MYIRLDDETYVEREKITEVTLAKERDHCYVVWANGTGDNSACLWGDDCKAFLRWFMPQSVDLRGEIECPVCDGDGEVYEGQLIDNSGRYAPKRKLCKACSGTGKLPAL